MWKFCVDQVVGDVYHRINFIPFSLFVILILMVGILE